MTHRYSIEDWEEITRETVDAAEHEYDTLLEEQPEVKRRVDEALGLYVEKGHSLRKLARETGLPLYLLMMETRHRRLPSPVTAEQAIWMFEVGLRNMAELFGNHEMIERWEAAKPELLARLEQPAPHTELEEPVITPAQLQAVMDLVNRALATRDAPLTREDFIEHIRHCLEMT